ncbi:MAG: 16S rRNA (guanine(527)-N(7))-methyltransferase RsmG [Anaerocolumna sp.]
MDQIYKIKEEINKINVDISSEQASQLLTYYNMLIEKNKVMNLTGITEFDDVLRKHFVDSLSITKAHDFSGNCKILDLGTGAGFPGIPLKIVFPHLKIVLMDSLNKRLNFLNEVIQELGLKDIETVHGRAEELGNNLVYREKFDICVSRAVAKLSSLSEYCIPFVKVGGAFIAYKADEITSELESADHAILILGGKYKEKYSLILPGSDIQRNLVVIDKIKNTPKKYPRQAGKPNKEPL